MKCVAKNMSNDRYLPKKSASKILDALLNDSMCY